MISSMVLIFIFVVWNFCGNKLFAIESRGEPGAQEVRNERALFVSNRVQHKLTGT